MNDFTQRMPESAKSGNGQDRSRRGESASARGVSPREVAQRALADSLNRSPRVQQQFQMRESLNSARAPVQRVTGLAKGGRMAAFQEQFTGITGTKKEKLEELLATVNSALEAEGVPPILALQANRRVPGARFQAHTWTIEFDPDLEEFDSDAQLADSLYHEARHAEQVWRVAIAMANRDRLTAPELERELSIFPEIAVQATYLVPEWSDEESRENALWEQDLDRAGFARYMEIDARQNEAQYRGVLAWEGFDYGKITKEDESPYYRPADPNRAIVEEYVDLLRRIGEVYESFRAYRETSIEKDAWAVGRAMGRSLGAPARSTADDVNRAAARLPDAWQLMRMLRRANSDTERKEVFTALRGTLDEFLDAIESYKLSGSLEPLSLGDFDLEIPPPEREEREEAPRFRQIPIEGTNRVQIVFEDEPRREDDSGREEEFKKKAEEDLRSPSPAPTASSSSANLSESGFGFVSLNEAVFDSFLNEPLSLGPPPPPTTTTSTSNSDGLEDVPL